MEQDITSAPRPGFQDRLFGTAGNDTLLGDDGTSYLYGVDNHDYPDRYCVANDDVFLDFDIDSTICEAESCRDCLLEVRLLVA